MESLRADLSFHLFGIYSLHCILLPSELVYLESAAVRDGHIDLHCDHIIWRPILETASAVHTARQLGARGRMYVLQSIVVDDTAELGTFVDLSRVCSFHQLRALVRSASA